MLRDIPQLVVEKIIVAVVREPDEETDELTWNVYLINLYDEPIQNVMVSSKGYGTHKGEDVKTSVLRHMIGNMDGNEYAKIEPIIEDVFGLNNEYWVSFYLNGQIYDKKYVFVPETIKEENFTMVPVIRKRGVMIR